MFGITRPRYPSTSFSMKTSRCALMVARVVGLMAVMFLVLLCDMLNLGVVDRPGFEQSTYF